MPELLQAGNVDFLGGQDASKIPCHIADNCYYSGINVSTKRGAVQPRWGFERKTLTYPEGGYFNANNVYVTYKELFESGKFQLIAAYPVGNVERLLIVINGIIFLLNINYSTLSVVQISDGSMLNPRAPRLNWCTAGTSMVIFDFPSYPVIVTGSTARRADPALMEVPVSTNGTFNQNRLIVANAGIDFTAGDPVGSLITPNAPITFEEVMTPSSPYYGQVFQLTTASTDDPITAMGFLQVVDTSTGIGPLLIATTKAIYSYATQNPRSDWDQGKFGAVVVYNNGVVGPRAWCNVNSDLFFLSADGFVRTLSMSRAEQARWSKIPISREVELWMKYNDPALKQFAFVSYFKNKVFFSANPYRIQAVDYSTRRPISDYAHAGLVVLELDNVVSFGEPVKPTWAGLWTGVNPMDMVVLNERAFIVSKDNYSINAIWEVNPDTHYDTSDCSIRYVRSRIYTKEFNFGDDFSNKEAHSIDMNLEELTGDVQVDVKYKAAHSPKFLPWGVFKYNVPWRICSMPCDGPLEGFVSQIVRDLTFGSPTGDTEECNVATEEIYKVFKKVQLEITFKGIYWELHEYRIIATPRPQNTQDTACTEYPVVATTADCNDDWYVEDFNLCPAQQTMT